MLLLLMEKKTCFVLPTWTLVDHLSKFNLQTFIKKFLLKSSINYQ